VERQMRQRVKTGGGGKGGAEEHQQQVARRPGDEPGDHGWAPSAKPFNAAFRLLSASIRKLADVTTGSSSARPSRTSTEPSPRWPSLTSRGSNRPSPLSTSTACRLPLSSTALSGMASTDAALP